MSNLPQVPGERVIRALERAGFRVDRTSGGHALMVHTTDPRRRATVPKHGSKPIRPGTLRSILRGAELTAEELDRLL